MMKLSHPAARRGSTVSLPAPDRPWPPDAAWSCLLSSRAFSSLSKSARSIFTGLAGKPTVAAYGASEPHPAEATSAAESATTPMRRSQIMPSTLLADRGRTDSGSGHGGRLLPDGHQLGQHRQQPFHDP